MSRKYLDQMMEEMEYANYQRWLTSHTSVDVAFNAPSLHSEYLNYINTSRFDFSTRGCYMPKYWMLPHLSRSNRESYYLMKRSEERSLYRNHQADKYYPKDYSLCQNRPKFGRGGGFSGSGGRWNEFSSANPYSERQSESRFAVRSSRYPEQESSSYQCNHHRRFIHDRLESPEMLNDKDRDVDLDYSCGSPSSTSLKEYTEYQSSESQSQSVKIEHSTSQLSDVSGHTPSPEVTTEYASWYNAEEQEEIVNMLREVNMRHDRQLQRDIMTANSFSDESRNHSSMDDGHESDDEEDEEDDGITVLLSSEMALPEVMVPEVVCDDYLLDKAPDGFVEYQSIFVSSPQKIIIDALTKESPKNESLLEKEGDLLGESCVESKGADNLVVEERDCSFANEVDAVSMKTGDMKKEITITLGEEERDGSFANEVDAVNMKTGDMTKEITITFGEVERYGSFANEVDAVNLKAGDMTDEVGVVNVENGNDNPTEDEIKCNGNVIETGVTNEEDFSEENLNIENTQQEMSGQTNAKKYNEKFENILKKNNVTLEEIDELIRGTLTCGKTQKENTDKAEETKENQKNRKLLEYVSKNEITDVLSKEKLKTENNLKLDDVANMDDVELAVESKENINEVKDSVAKESKDLVMETRKKDILPPEDLITNLTTHKTGVCIDNTDVRNSIPSLVENRNSISQTKPPDAYQISPIRLHSQDQALVKEVELEKAIRKTNEEPPQSTKIYPKYERAPQNVAELNPKQVKSVGSSSSKDVPENTLQLKVSMFDIRKSNSKAVSASLDSEVKDHSFNMNFAPHRMSKHEKFPHVSQIAPSRHNISNFETKRGFKTIPPAFTTLRHVKMISNSNVEALRQQHLYPETFETSQRILTHADSNYLLRPRLPNFKLVQMCRPNVAYNVNEAFQMLSPKLNRELNESCKSFFWRKIPYFVQQTGLSRGANVKSDIQLNKYHPPADEVKKTSFSETQLPFKNAEMHYKRISVAELFQGHQKEVKMKTQPCEKILKEAVSNYQNCESATVHLKNILRIGSTTDGQEVICSESSKNCTTEESKKLLDYSENKTPIGNASNEVFDSNASYKTTHMSGNLEHKNGEVRNSEKKQIVQDNATTIDAPKSLNVDGRCHARSHDDEKYEEKKSMDNPVRNDRPFKYSYANSRKSYYRKNNRGNQYAKWIPEVNDKEDIRDRKYKNDKSEDQEQKETEPKTEMVQKVPPKSKLDSLRDHQNKKKDPSKKMLDERKPESGIKQNSKKKAKNKPHSKIESLQVNDVRICNKKQHEMQNKQSSFETKETAFNNGIKCREEMHDVNKNKILYNARILPSIEFSSENDAKKLSTSEISSTHYSRNKYEEKKNNHASKEINTYSTDRRWKSDYFNNFDSNRTASSNKYNARDNICSRCHKLYDYSSYYERPRNTSFGRNIEYRAQYVYDDKYHITERETRELQTKHKESTQPRIQNTKTGSLKSLVLEDKVVLKSVYRSKDSSLPRKNTEVKSVSKSELKARSGGTKSNIISNNDDCQKLSIDQTENKKQDHGDTTEIVAPAEAKSGISSLEACNNSRSEAQYNNGGSKNNFISKNDDYQKLKSIALAKNKNQNHGDTTEIVAPAEANSNTSSFEACNNNRSEVPCTNRGSKSNFISKNDDYQKLKSIDQAGNENRNYVDATKTVVPTETNSDTSSFESCNRPHSEVQYNNKGSKSNIISKNNDCQKLNSIDQTYEKTGNNVNTSKDAAQSNNSNLKPSKSSRTVASSDDVSTSSPDKKACGETSKSKDASNFSTTNLNYQMLGKSNTDTTTSPTYEKSRESEAKVQASEIKTNNLKLSKNLSQTEGREADAYKEVLKSETEVENFKLKNEFSLNKDTSFSQGEEKLCQDYIKKQNESFKNITETDVYNINEKTFPCQKTTPKFISNMLTEDTFNAAEDNSKRFNLKRLKSQTKDVSTKNSKALIFESEKSNPKFDSEATIPNSKKARLKSHKYDNQIQFGTLSGDIPCFLNNPNLKAENFQYCSQVNVALHGCEKRPPKNCRMANLDLNWVEMKTHLMVKQSKHSSEEMKYINALPSTRNTNGVSKSDTCLFLPHSKVLQFKDI